MDFLGIGASLLGGLLGGSSGGGGGTQTIVNEPWSGVKPYLTGESSYRPQTQPPINSDWIYWNYMMSQGAPVGPPPPMFVDMPQYTGQNVYDPPHQYQPARLDGPAYGDNGPHGARPPNLVGPGGLLDDPGGYPSGGNDGLLRPPAQPAPAPEPPAATGPSTADLERAQEYLRAYNLMQSTQEMPENIDALAALAWAQNNPDANAFLSGWNRPAYGGLDAAIGPDLGG